MKKLKTATILPKYLNANGDRGNIFMLKQRAELNGVDFSNTIINAEDNFKAEDFDFYYIGGAADEFNPVVVKSLLGKKELFQKIKALSKTIFGVCFGYQILGNNYIFEDDRQIQCLGLLDIFTVQKTKRHVGNVTAKMNFLSPNYFVGFENHTGATYLNSEVLPLSYIDNGFGNNGSDKTEGAILNNIVGTYLTGPVLPRNVYFADYLLKTTMETKYQEQFGLVNEENTLEEDVLFDFINAKY